jgi:large subunit ribosomal protein L9
VKASSSGRSAPADIAEALSADGIEVERSEVRLPGGPIRLVGEHHVKVHLHSDVEVDLTVTVVAEE